MFVFDLLLNGSPLCKCWYSPNDRVALRLKLPSSKDSVYDRIGVGSKFCVELEVDSCREIGLDNDVDVDDKICEERLAAVVLDLPLNRLLLW